MNSRMLTPIFLICLIVLRAVPAIGQDTPEPTWGVETISSVTDSSGTVELRIHAEIPEGYHIYSIGYECPNGGPLAAKIGFTTDSTLVKKSGALVAFQDVEIYDDIFECTIREFHGKAQFRQRFKVKSGKLKVKGTVDYQMCAPSGRCTLHTYTFEI